MTNALTTREQVALYRAAGIIDAEETSEAWRTVAAWMLTHAQECDCKPGWCPASITARGYLSARRDDA